jgi:hypothetical protein
LFRIKVSFLLQASITVSLFDALRDYIASEALISIDKEKDFKSNMRNKPFSNEARN